MKRILRGKLYLLRKSINNNNEPNTYGRAQLRTSNLQIYLSAKGKKIIWVEHNILKVYRIIKKRGESKRLRFDNSGCSIK